MLNKAERINNSLINNFQQNLYKNRDLLRKKIPAFN